MLFGGIITWHERDPDLTGILVAALINPALASWTGDQHPVWPRHKLFAYYFGIQLAVATPMQMERAVPVILALLTSFAHAEICDVVPIRLDSSPKAFSIAKSDASVLIAAVDDIGNDERRAASDLFWKEDPSSEEWRKRTQDFLAGKTSLVESDVRALADLQARLEHNELDWVAIESVDGHLARWLRTTAELYLMEFAIIRSELMKEEDLDHLLLITVGPALFLKQRHPELFKGVDFVGVDVTKSATPQRAEPSGTSTDADQLAAELEKRFSHNRGTLRQFKRLRSDLRSGRLKGSDAQIRQNAQRSFWRPARAAVDEWLQLQLKARREVRASPPKTSPLSAIWTQLEAHPGRGVFIVTPNLFEVFQGHLAEACRLNTR